MSWRRWVFGTWSWWRPLASLASIYGLLLVIAVFFADRVIFIPPPASYPRDADWLVWLDTPQGDRIAALHLPATPGQPTLLYSHGNAEDIGHSLEIFHAWHELGIGVLAYDYPGYGLSTGRATEKSTHAAIRAAWDALRKKGLPRESIVIVGRSVGSGPSTRLAAEVKPAGLVLIAPFTSTFEVAFPVTLFPGDRFRNIDLIGGIHSPLLVIHGRNDEVIPLDHGKTLHQKSAAMRKELRIIDDAGHNDLFAVQGPEIIDAVADFARDVTTVK